MKITKMWQSEKKNGVGKMAPKVIQCRVATNLPSVKKKTTTPQHMGSSIKQGMLVLNQSFFWPSLGFVTTPAYSSYYQDEAAFYPKHKFAAKKIIMFFKTNEPKIQYAY